MKNKMIKRGIVCILAVSMLFTATACKGGQKEAQKTKMSAEDKNTIYKYEELTFTGGDTEELNSFMEAGGQLYAQRYYYDDELNDSHSFLCKLDVDGTETQLFEIKSGWGDGSGFGYQNYMISPEGKIYATKYQYESSEDEVTGEYSYTETHSLVSLDENGDEVWSVELGEDASKDGGEYYYVNVALMDGNGSIWVVDEYYITSYDQNGNKGMAVKNVDNFSEIFLTQDGNFMIGSWNDDWTEMSFEKLDTKKCTFDTQTYHVPGSYYGYNYRSGGNSQFDMFATNSIGIYGFNWGDTEMTKVMDFILSDLDVSNMYQIVPMGDNSFVGVYYDLDWNGKVASFEKVPADEVEDKYIMTLACHYLDNDIKKSVIDYNRTQEKLRIVVKDYSVYRTDDNYDEGIEKLNADLLAGDIPDIIIAPQEVDLSVYANKGIFADLYELMDKDDTINREDYLSNILALGEQDGKLYELIPSFNAITYVGKTANVGNGYGWTYDDVNKLLEAKGEGVSLTPQGDTRESMLSTVMNMSFGQFYDSRTGECNFNSDAFIQFLELMNRYPDELDDDFYYNDDYWNNYESQWLEDKAILYYAWIYDFCGYMEYKQGYFGEDVSYVGFPTADGSCGSAAQVNFTIAISEEGDFKDAAWEFAKGFISEEYQDNKIEGCFPIKISSLEKKAKAEMEASTYVDEETGEVVENNNWMWINGKEIEISKPKEEDCQYVIDFLKQINYRSRYDDNIAVIVQEESAAYFAGEKSAKEVANIIQSRVNLYVNEKR